MEKEIKKSKHFVITREDFNRYGCPFCNCSNVTSKISGGGIANVECLECERNFVILSNNNNNFLKMNESFVSSHLSPFENKKHIFVARDIRPEGEGEYFRPRGVGYDLAGFVKSKQAGERIVKMFRKALHTNPKDIKCFVDGNEQVWLDYRPNEPKWIQVKVQYCKEHKKNIQSLNYLTGKSGIITEGIIKDCQNDKKVEQILKEKKEKEAQAER